MANSLKTLVLNFLAEQPADVQGVQATITAENGTVETLVIHSDAHPALERTIEEGVKVQLGKVQSAEAGLTTVR
jgi:hypothetical protein